MNLKARTGSFWLGAALALCLGTAVAAGKDVPAKAGGQQRLAHHGVIVDFSAKPVDPAQHELTEGSFAELRFRIVDEASGQPLKGIAPGAWMDMAQVIRNREGGEQKSCKEKVGLYLRGAVGIRPMLDLNSYFVVLMNKDASISVVDPLITMAGTTSTYATTPMKKPGADWVNYQNTRRLFVTLPKANEVAVIETDNFKVERYVPAGKVPTRIVLQPDQHYLWVGNNAADAKSSGVTVIDATNLKPAGFIATGAGHHEIAFSPDSRLAFVSNRDSGTVSVIDVARRIKLKDIKSGSAPLALGYSSLSRMLYVSDGRDGAISVIDGAKLEVVKRLQAQPGLGPLKITPDGRYALTVNTAENMVNVLDTASNELVQQIAINAQPYQIAYSETYAYVRSLGSEQVSMINLSTLGRGKSASVQKIVAGTSAPNLAGDLPIADSMASAVEEGTVFVVDPVDGTTYYYREGMNAPSSNYRVYGSSARAVTVVDRSIKEVEPGVYAGRVRIPVAGKYDVAFMLESPQILHCFTAEAKADPLHAKEQDQAVLEFDHWPHTAKVGETLKLRFTLRDPATGKPKAGVKDAQAMYYLAPGSHRTQVAAREIGGGVYEIEVKLPQAGGYYVYMAVPSMQLGFGKLPFFSVRAVAPNKEHGAVASTG